MLTNSVCLSVCRPVCALTLVNIDMLLNILLKLTIAYLILIIVCVTFLVHLQRRSKVYRYITVYWKKILLCILMILSYFKNNINDRYSDQYYMKICCPLEHAFCRLWSSKNLFIYRAIQMNVVKM